MVHHFLQHKIPPFSSITHTTYHSPPTGAAFPLPLHGLKLLDSGCGTGNYATQFVTKCGFRDIHCSDFNGAMVKEAEKNIRTLDGDIGKGVKFSSDDVCNMVEMPSNHYDCVCNNQVVHHLRPDENFADLRKACKEW